MQFWQTNVRMLYMYMYGLLVAEKQKIKNRNVSFGVHVHYYNLSRRTLPKTIAIETTANPVAGNAWPNTKTVMKYCTFVLSIFGFALGVRSGVSKECCAWVLCVCEEKDAREQLMEEENEKPWAFIWVNN